MVKKMSVTEVKNRFDRVLREVLQTGGPIVVERDGKPVAVILSVSEYERTQPRSSPVPEQTALLQSSFGMWANRGDIDDDWLAEGRSYQGSKRPFP